MIKNENIHMRVSSIMKNEMKIEAEKFGLSVTNYLIFLHCNNMRGGKIA